MNWRYVLGSAANRVEHAVMSVAPHSRYVPTGRNWLYDVRRFAGGRRIEVILDVGANEGQTAWGLVRYFPHAKIHCFEPVSSTMAKLQARYSRYSNIAFHQSALGSAPGQVTIPLHAFSELNTLVRDQPRTEDLTGSVETISVGTLDAFCIANGIDMVDLLKMDVQGWETEVLAGAAGLVRERRIRFIFAEVGFRRADSDMSYFDDINALMEREGYWLCGFYNPFRWGARKQFLGFADALFALQDQVCRPGL